MAKSWGERATPVVTATVKEQRIAPTRWSVAEVLSQHDTRIAAENKGRIVWLANTGQTFHQGETLVKLADTQDIPLKIAQVNAILETQKIRLSYSEKEISRLQSLAKTNHASQAQLDTKLKEQALAQAKIHSVHGELALLETQKNKTTVTAPFNGLVMQRLKQPHEWAQQGEALLHFVSTQRLEIKTFAPLAHLSALKVDDAITYRLNSNLHTGIITGITPAGSAQSHQAELRISPNQTAESTPLHIGDIVQVAIPTQTAKQALTVPRDALILRKGRISVYKVNDDNSATSITVTTGVANHSDIEVLSDALQAGDQVVVRGGERLRPGQTVNILNAPKDKSYKGGDENHKLKKAWGDKKKAWQKPSAAQPLPQTSDQSNANAS